ncbi:hypothetical protein [Variovorax sp. J22R115]|nr:hypothetical protein [Variovorax sp. J22R115]MDM0049797.1 hypothetical protein [Variovorax sp. J22R115]
MEVHLLPAGRKKLEVLAAHLEEHVADLAEVVAFARRTQLS